jgi:hypothetical protein
MTRWRALNELRRLLAGLTDAGDNTAADIIREAIRNLQGVNHGKN